MGAESHIVEIVIHFGINPVNGGIPLRESNIIGIISCIVGDIRFNLLNCLLLDWDSVFKMMNRGIIIEQYII